MSDENKPKTIELPPVNRETIEKVKKWMDDEEARVAAEAPKKKEAIVLPDDPIANAEDRQDQTISAAITGPEPTVSITDTERDTYLKAILTDSPVILNIAVMHGKLNLRFRSRTMHEQERVLAVVREDIKDKLIEDGDGALLMTRIQEYCVCLQLQQIEGKVFSELELKPGSRLKEDILKLRRAFTELIPSMQHVRWVPVHQGLIVFEAKCKKLAEESINENF